MSFTRRHVLTAITAAALLGAAIWSLYPRPALASALVAHMAHEPQSWARTEVPVTDSTLGAVLARSGLALNPGMPLVTYAHSCWFRGWFVPHLVVQTARGPVTVLVLRHERVARAMPVDEGGYRGVVVPASDCKRGAFALLVRDAGAAADVTEVAVRVTAAVRFVD